MGLLDVTNPRDTYADKILREASVNRTENHGLQRKLEMCYTKRIVSILFFCIITQVATFVA